MNRLIFSLVFLMILKSIHSLSETCAKNSDCSTINSLCINAECTCGDLSYYNDTQCLPYATEYQEICHEDLQCEWLGENSECSHNRCVCNESYRWYKGKCQKYVDKGEKCGSDDECYNGYDLLSLTCSKETCDCRKGYYNRGYDCRKTSVVLGDCAIDLDCQLSLFECILGKCTLKSVTNFDEEIYETLSVQEETSIVTFLQKEDPSPLACANDGDCRDMANSLCDISTKTCECIQNGYYLYNGNCIRGISHCDSNNDCAELVNNSICFKSSCVCQQGFFLKDNKCIAELGVEDPHNTYEEDSDCPIKPGQLINSTCYCRNYWFNDESNRNCIKTMIQSTHTCLTNEWCAVMGPYSFCNVTSSSCQCSSVAKFNNKTYYCELQANAPDIICLRDTDCDTNERCLNEQCECSENFSKNKDNICVPNIGGSCTIQTCSHIKNSNCVGATCMCDNDYIGKETQCLRMAEALEDPCEEQEQCYKIPHAMCGESETYCTTIEYNTTLRCVCDEGYTDVKESCYQNKKLGDPCMTEADCTLVLNRSYKCRNSLCQCGVGQSLKNGYCTSSGNIAVAGYLVWMIILVKLMVTK